jgi:C4-type Zn-finger protein
LIENALFGGNRLASKEPPPEPDASASCPQCGTELAIARVTPVLLGGACEELTLVCKTCGFTRKISVKRS